METRIYFRVTYEHFGYASECYESQEEAEERATKRAKDNPTTERVVCVSAVIKPAKTPYTLREGRGEHVHWTKERKAEYDRKLEADIKKYNL